MEGLFAPTHFVIMILILVLPVFFLLTLRKALARCSRENRTTSPDSVWLMLIPLFNLVYQFILVGHIAKSLGNEFARRGMANANRKPGKSLGVAACVLGCLLFCVLNVIPVLDVVSGTFDEAYEDLRIILSVVVVFSTLVCWIVYWVRIAGYSRKISAPFAGSPHLESAA